MCGVSGCVLTPPLSIEVPFCRRFSIEQVAGTVNGEMHVASSVPFHSIAGLCDIIGGSTTSKTLCTRALWCLANQNLSTGQMGNHVVTIVTIVTEMLLSQQQATPTVDTEALNLFMR